MGWSIGYDENWKRDIGYGVPAICDHPKCDARIDRGLGYVCCEQKPYGGDRGCGLFFCGKHTGFDQRCPRCSSGHRSQPYKHPKPDVMEWIEHKLNDESWQQWRDESPEEVARLRAALPTAPVHGQIDAHHDIGESRE